ncbi:hypothetical protein [Ramlibacter albus]|uniref:Uncharacterized protein n=1 Tax=Ramlibacter albus TaxID=2079448 RepID=A0A923M733_9BURK|nr:hypothetical protein [Ramlibacter albus]MBC5764004.1 hypothetical protein [Ramlibacter albus]
MSTPTVTFVSLAAELQQRFALAAGEVHVLERLQVAQFVSSGVFEPWPAPDLLRHLHASLEALDVEKPGAGFVNHFAQATRCRDLLQAMATQAGPYAEQAATPLRRLALDIGMHTGVIGNVARDVDPMLQTLGQLLSDRDKMLRHAQAQAHVRSLFTQAADYVKRTQLLKELAESGRNSRASLTALIDAQKALLATVQGGIAEAWAAWQPPVAQFAAMMSEHPSNARYHPSVPGLQKRLLELLVKAIEDADAAEVLRNRAKEQLVAVQRQVSVAKGWVSGPPT